jgi:hypothetical protein
MKIIQATSDKTSAQTNRRNEMQKQEPVHSMTFVEREQLKTFARGGKSLEELLIIVAYWMRCYQDVSFSDYAANWIAANTLDDVSAISAEWPLTGPRKIADNCSDWGSYKSEVKHEQH